jgi:hypothetical protein
VDLQIAGAWPGFTLPKAMGRAQLHSVRAHVRGLNAPLEIVSANLILAPETIQVASLTALLAGGMWHGSLTVPRQCTSPETCPVDFDLHVDQIASDDWNRLLNPAFGKRPWYRFLSSTSSPNPFLSSLHAAGKITANQVAIHNLVADRVSANIQLDSGILRISDLRGDVLGGKHSGQWQADFTSDPPVYSGSGSLDQINLGQVGGVMHEDWITGTATLSYEAKTSGLDATDLLSSAEATLRIDAHDTVLPRITLTNGSVPLYLNHFQGRAILRDGQFEIQQGKLETPASIYQVSGTASLDRTLDIKLLRDPAHIFSITGTLGVPHVALTVLPETRAALKQ